MAVMGLLLLRPSVGLLAFWSVLIPLAPAILAVAPGLWRNICPLGSTALFPRHREWSRRERIGETWQGRMQLLAVLVLLAVVPLGHVVLNRSGPATFGAFTALAAVGFVCGLRFEWKSAWCSTICPVFPVEQLYGAEPAVSLENAHCEPCEECVSLCPDSLPGVDSLTAIDTRAGRASAVLITGGFAGYVWGWFQVPDFAAAEGFRNLGAIYAPPLVGLAASLIVFLVLRRLLPWHHEWRLARAFGAAAIAVFFWYRLPALFGFGVYPEDGLLVDLTGTLPAWTPIAMRAATTAFFGWWLVIRGTGQRSW